MKKLYTHYLLLAFIFLIFGCDPKKQVAKLKIIVPEAGSSVRKGQPLLVKLEVPSELSALDSIQFTVDGKTISVHVQADSILIDTQDLEFGQKTIGAKIFAKGQTESAYSNIVVVPAAPRKYGFKVVRELPHDPQAFTQGLEVKNGIFYESTGQYDGKSSLRRVAIETGKVLNKINLDNEFFGEGMTIIGNQIIQLTYLERKAFVYDANTLRKLKEFNYDSKIKEGWGLCYNGTELILSEGTNFLHFVNPEDFSVQKSIPVFNHQGPVHNLNELEYIDGLVYANVYQTDIIVIIDPNTGAVVGEINLIGIYPEKNERQYDNELNGIAHDPITKTLYVTGKNWAKLFQIEIVKQ